MMLAQPSDTVRDRDRCVRFPGVGIDLETPGATGEQVITGTFRNGLTPLEIIHQALTSKKQNMSQLPRLLTGTEIYMYI